MDKEEGLAHKKNTRSARLKQERERHGWSQSELAERLGTTQANISRWEKGSIVPSPYFRRKLAEVFGKSLEELGLFLAVDEEEAEANTNEASPASVVQAAPMTLSNIPYRRNAFFTGRESILSDLYITLTSRRIAALTQARAISGLGGIGKTQIAIEYAYRYGTHYQAMLWVTAFSREKLVADFVMLAALLNLPEKDEQDQTIVIRAVKLWLTTSQAKWLLIFDNVDDLAMLEEFLPAQGSGDVLLTTRLQALGTIAQSIEVEKMEEEEGVMFLLRRVKALAPDAPLQSVEQVIREQAAEVVAELDGLPLALDQAGAYMEETRCGFLAYQELYRTRRKELLLRRGRFPVDHPEPVAATWSLSFQQVEQESPAAADLLRLLAFLSPEAIPDEILSIGAAELGPILSPIASDVLELNAAIELLLRYSLVRRDPEARMLHIHRLVQAVLKDSLGPDLQRQWAERAIRACNRAFPDVELHTWGRCQRCLPHAQVCALHLAEYGLAFPEAARLLNQAALYMITHASYDQAEPLLLQALIMREKVLAEAHPDIAAALNDLGTLYLTQGKYQQSEPLLQQALAIREKVLGLEHPDTAASLKNLASLCSAQGKYVQAEQLYQQALHIRQHVLASEHPAIAQSRRDLAELYVVQGKYVQAEELYLQAQESQEKTLGLHHPDMAKTLNNLAFLYRSTGEYERAEQFFQQALSIQEQVLGQMHPDVAQTLYNLARLYRAQGKYAEAEPFYQRALSICQEVFGPDHPRVAQIFYGLSKVYNSQGKYQQAAEMGERALRIQEQRLGNDHPDLAYTLGTLAKIYEAQQRLDEAVVLSKRALQIREQTSDAFHPHIAHLSNNLAEIYHAQGKYREAEPLASRALAIHMEVLGSDHPYTAYSLSNLAENSLFQRDYVQAESLFRKALAIREQNLGEDHPRTAVAYHNLARLYHAQKRYEEAEFFYSKALTICEQTLDREHPTIIKMLEQYNVLLTVAVRERSAEKYGDRTHLVRFKDMGEADLHDCSKSPPEDDE